MLRVTTGFCRRREGVPADEKKRRWRWQDNQHNLITLNYFNYMLNTIMTQQAMKSTRYGKIHDVDKYRPKFTGKTLVLTPLSTSFLLIQQRPVMDR